MLCRCSLLIVALLIGVSACPVWGIVVSDNPDSHVVTPPSDYDMVGYLSMVGGAAGSLIDDWYVLTAKHVVQPYTTGNFTLHLAGGDEVYVMEEKFLHPDVDLAVIRLGRNTMLGGYDINQSTSEIGEEGILVGYGMSGTDGTVGPGGDPAYPRGTKRFGYNLIDAFSSGQTQFKMDFDNPTTTGLPGGSLGADREVMIADGDSGGPTFIEVAGELKLAGVHVSVFRNDPNHWPRYGDTGYDVRIRNYKDWILDLIPDQSADWTGDFNNDDSENAEDIDLLQAEIRAGGSDLWYDLTHDQIADTGDRDMLVRDILSSQYGDVDLDGKVNGADLSILAGNWLEEVDGWSYGDFTGDCFVDGADLSLMAQYWLWGEEGEGGPMGFVPEPMTASLFGLAGVALLRRRGKRQ